MRTRTIAVAVFLALLVTVQLAAQPEMPPPPLGEMPPDMGGEASVEKIVFSPDGTMLSAVAGGVVKTWEIASGEPVEALARLGESLLAVAWNPGGTTIAVGGADGIVTLFDAQGELLHTLEGHTDYVRDLAFTPAGSILASAADDGSVRLWDVNSGELLRALDGHPDYVRSVAFGPRGQLLASGCDDGTVRLWDAVEGSLLRELTGHTDYVRAVDISPDGTLIASGSDDTSVRLWNAVTGEEVAVLAEHVDWIRDLAFSPDGSVLASGGDDAVVYLWDVKSHEPIRSLQATGWVTALAWGPDGARITTGAVDGVVSLWDAADGALLASAGGRAPALLALALSPDGQTLVACSGTDRLLLWDLTSEETLARTVQVQGISVAALAFNRSGNRIAAGGYGPEVALIESASGKLVRTLDAPQSVIALQVDRRGRLWAASPDATLTAWDMAEGAIIRQVSGSKHSVMVLDTNSGSVVTSTQRTGEISAATFRQDGSRAFVGSEEDRTLCVALSRDGRLLATGSADGSVQLGNAGALNGVTLEGEPHWDYVRGVAFSPDGKLLASASDDGTVKLWSVKRRHLLRTLEGHTDWVRAVAFIDNDRLVSCADDGTARIWSARSGDELRVLNSMRPTAGKLVAP